MKPPVVQSPMHLPSYRVEMQTAGLFASRVTGMPFGCRRMRTRTAIDHVVAYAHAGFDADVRRKLDRLTKLWVEHANIVVGDESGDEPHAIREWRLALEGFGRPEDFSDVSRILGKSATWESVTPFLASGHLKAGGYPAEVRRLLSRRRLLEPTEITPLSCSRSASDGDPQVRHTAVMVRGRPRRAVHFHRFRSRGREEQRDTTGIFLRLTFPAPIEGPLALGYACHFGLGLFTAV